MTADAVTVNDDDRTAAGVAWDIEPLVDRQGRRGRRGAARRGGAACRRARHLPRPRRRARCGRSRRSSCTSSPASPSSSAAPVRMRACASRSTPRIPPAARCSLAPRSAPPRSRTSCCSSSSNGRSCPTSTSRPLLADDALAFCRHHLASARRYRPHLLTEPEERTARRQGRHRAERLGAPVQRADVHDRGRRRRRGREPRRGALAAAVARTASVARQSAEAVTAALEPGLRTRAFVFNTLLADKSVDDRLRSYGDWISSRNLDNEASDESVQALVDAVVARYDIPQRWYALKARLLGLDRLADYDRIGVDRGVRGRRSAGRTRATSCSTRTRRSRRELADVVQRFLDDAWIDAPMRPGKRPGAFCAYTVPSHHPYLLLNWTARRRDVLTLAHELGHGVHAYLARGQGRLPPVDAAHARRDGVGLRGDRDVRPAARRDHRPGGSSRAARREPRRPDRHRVPPDRDEPLRGRRAHRAPRARASSPSSGSASCGPARRPSMLGDAVEVTDGYRTWWSYIPHFIGDARVRLRLRVRAAARAVGLPAVRGARRRLRPVVPRAALARWVATLPRRSVGSSGVDLADPEFWDGGLTIVEEQLDAAEQAAKDAGRL